MTCSPNQTANTIVQGYWIIRAIQCGFLLGQSLLTSWLRKRSRGHRHHPPTPRWVRQVVHTSCCATLAFGKCFVIADSPLNHSLLTATAMILIPSTTNHTAVSGTPLSTSSMRGSSSASSVDSLRFFPLPWSKALCVALRRLEDAAHAGGISSFPASQEQIDALSWEQYNNLRSALGQYQKQYFIEQWSQTFSGYQFGKFAALDGKGTVVGWYSDRDSAGKVSAAAIADQLGPFQFESVMEMEWTTAHLLYLRPDDFYNFYDCTLSPEQGRAPSCQLDLCPNL